MSLPAEVPVSMSGLILFTNLGPGCAQTVLASGSYVGNSAYNAGSCTWRFDDVTISGAPMVFAPTIAITTPSSSALTVANAITAYDLAGTSSNLVGNLGWANALTASAGTLPASATWSISGVALPGR